MVLGLDIILESFGHSAPLSAEVMARAMELPGEWRALPESRGDVTLLGVTERSVKKTENGYQIQSVWYSCLTIGIMSEAVPPDMTVIRTYDAKGTFIRREPTTTPQLLPEA